MTSLNCSNDIEFRKRLGIYLKACIKYRNMSQKDVSLQTGIDSANLSRILNGKYSPSFDIIIRIARVLRLANLPIYHEQLP